MVCGVIHGCSNNSKKNPGISFNAIPTVRKHERKETEELSQRRRDSQQQSLSPSFYPSVDDNDKTEKSMQAQVDKFNVSQCVLGLPVPYPIEIFIKTQETKLRASLGRHIIQKKKEIYSSIKTTIQQKMAPGYKRAAEVRGDGCMERMEAIITEMIEDLKNHMFSEAKLEALKMFNDLKLYIIKTLESELMNSVERFLSQTSEISLMDVSREIEELERLSQQLSD